MPMDGTNESSSNSNEKVSNDNSNIEKTATKVCEYCSRFMKTNN